ncbi:MAG: TonB-dependent receptor [Dysgonamonadaceae bacterium]|jgi:TonB-linked SusC/RagA family outer membrane protein|nr:TonB-dependent receptor [Dysgonamonadaceae bacterium]
MKKQIRKQSATAIMLLCTFLCTASLFAQSKLTINGTITDTAGDPVVGASVVEKGITNGTVTDVSGNFSMFVNQDATLVISYIGYLTQEVKASNNMTIILKEDTKLLDEVVVVGYGTQKRSDITGSVVSVPKDRLSNLPVNNVMQAIQGIAAGVNVTQSSSIPGDAPSTLVRGRGSVNLSTEPYYVVDGIPLSKTDGSINDINPNDIESVEILKDPSAVAIYGVNGANGVVLITTKRGTLGKPVIRYGGYAGMENIAHIFEPGSPEQLLARYKEYARIQQAPLQYDPVRNQFEKEQYDKGIVTDWLDVVTQTGITQNHDISLNGGNEYARYYMSGALMDQKGVVKGYNYKRYSFRVNLDVNPTKYLTIGTSSYFAFHNRDGGRANLLNAAAMSPYGRMYDEDGSLERYPMYSEQLWANPLIPTMADPQRRQKDLSINGYAELDLGKLLSPLSGLKYKLNAGYFYTPRQTNRYEGKAVFNENGWAQMYHEESDTYTIENILSYSKDFGLHHFDLTGLYAASSKFYWTQTSEASVFPTDAYLWWNLGAASTEIAGSYADKRNMVSQMGRLNYNYASRYLFTFTVRRDGSSVFGKNNKYAVFPSFALGWNITGESFMESYNKTVNNLKLRLSYGSSGNGNLDVYQTESLLSSSNLAMNGASLTTLKVASGMGNDNLRWEKSLGFNVGLDFGLWSNRVNGTLEVYNRESADLLLTRNLPYISGFSTVKANIGKTSNKGVELTINSKNIVAKNFTWATTLVFAHNASKWIDIYGDGKDDIGNWWFIGKPVGVIYDYTKVGIWQEDEIASGANKGWDDTAQAGDLKLADISGPDGVPDGKVDATYDRSVLGQTDPKWTGGLTNTFTYKNLSLSIFINTVQGHKRNNTEVGTVSDELGRRNGPAEIGYWTPENKSNEWRSLGNHSNSHSYGFPEDAGYTRIKDVTLSYNLPANVVKSIGIGGLQIYASGRNLYTFTKWLGWDPEARALLRGTTESNGSITWENNYPTVRSLVFGLNITF